MASVDLKPLPLPSESVTYNIWQKDWPQYLSAYKLAFDAEKDAAQQAGPTGKNNVMFARVAGFLLIELFDRRAILTEEPCERLSKALQSEDREGGTTNDHVFKIGKFYRNHFIRLFRTTTTVYPSPSLHPSRPSFDTLEDMIKDSMDVDGKDYRTARRKVLVRDGHRCLLTGSFDETSAEKSHELREQRTRQRAGTNVIAACHILNESTMQGVDPTVASENNLMINKTAYASSAMAILDSFGLKELVENALGTNGVHSLRNLLSLDPTCHLFFDRLNLWFEHTDEPNRYYVCVPEPTYELHLLLYNYLERDRNRLFVAFHQFDDRLELPDPQLLALHAACARVAHMSGAAEAFNEVERDVEDTRVLAFNGSDAHLVDHLLTPFVAIPGVA